MFANFIPNPLANYSVRADGSIKQQSDIAAQLGFAPDLASSMQNAEASHYICLLNILGYIPGVSTVSGSYRSLIGLAFVVKSVTGCIFDKFNQMHHIEGIKIGAANFGRGLLEIIPVIGNLFALNIDVSRMMHRWESMGPPYGDAKTIPAMQCLDQLGRVLVIGIITSLFRAVFFSVHTIVNIPPALITHNIKYVNAMKFGLNQVALGLVESIPIIGRIVSSMRYYVRNPDLLHKALHPQRSPPPYHLPAHRRGI